MSCFDFTRWYDFVSNISTHTLAALKLALYTSFICYLIMFIFSYIRKKWAESIMSQYLNRNLKSNYNFLDHTIDNYSLDASKLIICPEYEFHNKGCSKDKECVLVKHISHNRMQEIVMDEKHFFHIHFFFSDLKTKEALNKSWRENPKSICQPEDLNAMYPMVLGLKIAVILYYKHRGRYYFVHKDGSFVIDHVVNCDDIKRMFTGSNKSNANELENIVQEKIINKFKIKTTNTYNGFTDIGVDDDELYVRLFYLAEIENPDYKDKGYKYTKIKRIPKFIKRNSHLSCPFQSYIVKLNLLFESKIWE